MVEGNMKKWLFLAVISVFLLAVVGMGLVGFLPKGAAAADTVTPVNVNVNSQQGIWVNGQGTISVVPDIAMVNLGVSAQAPNVADALDQASGAMSKIMAALTAAGVAPKDIQTSYFNIQQIYNNRVKNIYPTPAPAPFLPPAGSSASGSAGAPIEIRPTPDPTPANVFQVDNTVAVKIRAIDKVGTVIDSVVAAGGDLTRVNGVNFMVEKPDQYYVQARQAAMADAAARAQQLAQLSGVTLGKAFYISENSGYQPMYYPSIRSSLAFAGQGTSMSPGQMDITLNLQVAYSIQ
jgi:uncharacterized protein